MAPRTSLPSLPSEEAPGAFRRPGAAGMQQRRLLSWAQWFGAFSSWPFHLVMGLLQRPALAWRRAASAVEGDPGAARVALGKAAQAWAAMSLTWPFDLARAQYAAGVQAGLVERSLLASAEFEQQLGRLERLTLGPWARSN